MSQGYDTASIIPGSTSPSTDISKLTASLDALRSVHSGATEPSSTIAYMYWADTTANLLKQRNAADSAWITRESLSEAFLLAKTTAYTTLAIDNDNTILADATSAGFTVTLLAASTAGDGYEIAIKKTDSSANKVTIDANASETIDGDLTKVLQTQYSWVVLRSDGSNWHIVGSGDNRAVLTKTTTYTVLPEDDRGTILSDVSGGSFTITLPAVSSVLKGFEITIKKTDSSSNTLTIDGDGSETIDGALDQDITIENSAITIISDGSSWRIINDIGSGGDAGLVLLSTATASASSSLDFTSLIDSTYDEYVFILSAIECATDDVDFYVRTSTDGGSSFDSGASDYSWSYHRALSSSSTAITRSDSNDSRINISNNPGSAGWSNSAGGSLEGVIRLHSPSSTNRTNISFHLTGDSATGETLSAIGGGQRQQGEDVNGVRFLFSSGNITSGNIRMYGVKI